MRIHYYPETDSLYIELSAEPSQDSTEVSNGVVVDYGASGKVVGIDIDQASKVVDMESLESVSFPVKRVSVA